MYVCLISSLPRPAVFVRVLPTHAAVDRIIADARLRLIQEKAKKKGGTSAQVHTASPKAEYRKVIEIPEKIQTCNFFLLQLRMTVPLLYASHNILLAFNLANAREATCVVNDKKLHWGIRRILGMLMTNLASTCVEMPMAQQLPTHTQPVILNSMKISRTAAV